MIDKIAVKSSLSLLKWLPVVAGAVFSFVAVSDRALAQQSGPDSNGYVVSGCNITTDNGTYLKVGTDCDGNP